MRCRVFAVLFSVTFLVLALTSCILSTSETKATGNDQDMKVRIKQLEDEMTTMREEYSRTAGSVADSVAAFDQLQSQVGVVESKLDESTFAANKYSQDYQELRSYLEEEMAKIDKRLYVLESKAGIKNAENIGAIPASGQTKPKTEEDEFREAENTFKQGDYESAKGKFKTFLTAHPKNNKADQATYYIAETYFKQRDYENAILEYHNIKERYKQSSYVVKSLFKIGACFQELGQTKDAKLFYNQVISDYPGSPEAQMAKKKLELLH